MTPAEKRHEFRRFNNGVARARAAYQKEGHHTECPPVGSCDVCRWAEYRRRLKVDAR